jgi:hypothetical protein
VTCLPVDIMVEWLLFISSEYVDLDVTCVNSHKFTLFSFFCHLFNVSCYLFIVLNENHISHQYSVRIKLKWCLVKALNVSYVHSKMKALHVQKQTKNTV